MAEILFLEGEKIERLASRFNPRAFGQANFRKSSATNFANVKVIELGAFLAYTEGLSRRTAFRYFWEDLRMPLSFDRCIRPYRTGWWSRCGLMRYALLTPAGMIDAERFTILPTHRTNFKKGP